MPSAHLIDARHLKCPLPVLKAEKQLARMSAGDVLVLLSDDPVARVDIPLLCQRLGHDCTHERQDKAIRFTITKR